MSSSGRRSAPLLAQVEQYLALSNQPKPLQIIYSTHPTWPFQPAQHQEQHRQPSKQVDIGVLDSSFNPPQLAHADLAKSKKPLFADEEGKQKEKRFYDSLLLIFSVRNADKGMGSKKDASTLNRLEMMKEFAKDLEDQTQTNVAVAIIEEPLMIAKSTLIHDYIKEQQKQQNSSSSTLSTLPSRLHWLVGFDTLQRFFQVKYYPSPEFFRRACEKYFLEEKTTFVCARRGNDSLPNKKPDGRHEQDEEKELLESDEVKPWLERGSVVMIDLDKSVQGISSTLVRKTVLEEANDNDKSKDRLKDRLQQLTTKRVAHYLIQEPVYGRED